MCDKLTRHRPTLANNKKCSSWCTIRIRTNCQQRLNCDLNVNCADIRTLQCGLAKLFLVGRTSLQIRGACIKFFFFISTLPFLDNFHKLPTMGQLSVLLGRSNTNSKRQTILNNRSYIRLVHT